MSDPTTLGSTLELPEGAEAMHPIDRAICQEAIMALKESRQPLDDEEILKQFKDHVVSAWRQRADNFEAKRQERLQVEAADRRRRRIAARRSAARIPPRFAGARFEDLDDTHNGHAIAACKGVADPGFKNSPPGLFLLGAPGNGKSTMAAAALIAFIEATEGYRPVCFWSVALELQRQRESMRDEDRDRVSQLADCNVVVIDDLDKVVRDGDRRSPWVDEMIFTVIDSLYARRRRVIITSNWTAQQAIEHLDYAVTSRITEMCRIVELAPHDYRVLGA